MPTYEDWKESLKKRSIKALDRMLFIKNTALNKKNPNCEAGWKGTPYCNPKLTKKEKELIKSNMERTEAMLKQEIQAITDEIHDREELTAEELEAKKSGEQPTLKF